MRRVLRVAGILSGLGVTYFLVSLLQVWNTGRSADRQPVDAIVVLGAAQYDGRPSPQLQARLDHALELWNLNLASYIVVTGGKQEGDRFTEAETARKFFEENR
ncbi:MAG: YdcF family protein, partial [Actinomycetota bacterium]